MPSEARHQEQAGRNTDVSDVLLSDHDEYSEWIITTAFYAAVHTIDAFLHSQLSYDPPGHERRLIVLGRTRPKAAAVYAKLRETSEQARYLCARFTQADVEKYRDDALVRIPVLLQ